MKTIRNGEVHVTRKAHLLALVVALCVIAAPALAGNAKSRTETGEYNTVTVDTDAPPQASGRVTNGVTFETQPGERFVSVTIEDKSGLPARAVVGQDLDGDGLEDVSEEICGSTAAPIKLQKGVVAVMVWTQEGACADGTNAFATFGTVTATFTRAAAKPTHHHHHH
jgi:hypothetical protein